MDVSYCYSDEASDPFKQKIKNMACHLKHCKKNVDNLEADVFLTEMKFK
jgi:hypothetical protein